MNFELIREQFRQRLTILLRPRSCFTLLAGVSPANSRGPIQPWNVLDEQVGSFHSRRGHKDLNPGLGKKAHSLGVSSPLSDLQAQGQPTRESKETFMNEVIQNRKTALSVLAIVGLGCFGFLPHIQAVSPPPGGCSPNFTTAEGCNALAGLGTGAGNTGLGWSALFGNSTGSFNTAVGGGALALNNGDSNTAVGAAALLFNTSGIENTAVGTDALVSNDTGSSNSAFGAFALFSNTAGGENTTNGYKALFNNTTGNENTAIGDSALFSNTGGGDNTAIGYHALFGNTGDLNTATGWSALSSNTTGAANTANGQSALLNNTIGNFNTAIGNIALQNNSTGSDNTATGYKALLSNSTGSENTAIGSHALENNTTGADNVAIGLNALQNNTGGVINVAIGNEALKNCTTGQLNYAIGADAGLNVTTASGVICIGSLGADNVDNTTWIGGIFGAGVTGDMVQVFISPEGQLAAGNSSRRFKKEIKPMDKASDVILALKPVSFKYNHDNKGTPCFGLIAEEVAQVDPNLVVRDKNGEIYSVRYDAVNAMLLNEFLKEHKAFVEEHRTVQDLKATVAQQQKQIEALTAGLQKVSARLELNKSAPETVSNTR